MNRSLNLLWLTTAAFGLSACNPPAVVSVPAPVAVPVPVPVPGPAGATGATGNTGATGSPGRPGDGTTVIVVEPPASAPR